MCDDDTLWNTMLSFTHDHDYGISKLNAEITHEHNSTGLILNPTIEDDSTIDDNIDTTLGIDLSFGNLHFENENYEVIY